MIEANLGLFRRRLLRWYRRNRRDLPWRQSRDPYAIWISETMLQQTQVKTVLPYYRRFITAIPSVQSLARARLQRVMRLWSGLGYYRRAENLHQAARQIMRQHSGVMPRDFDHLRALPGIGDYTAGALLSIAFGKKYPAIDGNVRRVLSRLLLTKSHEKIHSYAAKLAKTSDPGNLNQALMELGAMICIPNQPQCDNCPVAPDCGSRHRLGSQLEKIPTAKMTFRDVTWPLAIVSYRGKILLRRRRADGLLAKLWELPGSEINAHEKAEDVVRRELKPLAVAGLVPRRLGELRHSITNRRIHAPVLLYRWPMNQPGPEIKAEWHWVVPNELQRYATSSMTTKAVKLFLQHEKNSA